ncbi:hypothetical protein DCAR_0100617 [Daucus carota subsp. sativus]|uniref:MATH domain-containing protein n=1 Tax=Daucus carota subsp. sativus TaxID=79200 RepID=A0AAF0W0R0_DAUCS|nr:hypothetical protein DCAR_0100617 [Daucus carota subsp. sativus]
MCDIILIYLSPWPSSHGIYLNRVVRYLRDAPPAHYLVKIESFSRLANSGLEKCESAVFDASGYKWRLVLYPNGNTKRGGGGHISLYLAIDSDSLPLGWEAYVTYKMFVFDHHKDKYLTIQVHQIRRFHEAKKESGFDRLISLDTFNAARNGYLVDDQCVYGVEVHEVKYTGNGETFKMIEDPEDVTFDWMITDFSTMCREKLKSEKIDSEVFKCGESNWQLKLYPNGDSRSKDHLGLFLELKESPASGRKVLAEFWLVIKNQKSNYHHQVTGLYSWFSTSATEFSSDEVSRNWGWSSFMSLSDLKSESSGFIVNDTLLVQAKIKIKTEVTSFY